MSPTAHSTSRRNIGRVGTPNRRSFLYGVPPYRISRPARTATQARWARQGPWVLAFAPAGRRWIEPLMGWTAADDALAQIRLWFPSLASAVDYAERKDLDYTVVESPAKRPVRRTGSGDNTALWPELEMWQPLGHQQNPTDLEVQS